MDFKPLTVDGYETIKPFFCKQPHKLSVYSPFSLIVWSGELYKASYLILDGVLLISGISQGVPDSRHLIMPIAQERIFSPTELLSFAKDFGIQRYWYIPEDYLATADAALLEQLFIKVEQPEFCDYVYLTEDLISLRGNKFAKKRNLISQFTREYIRRGRVCVQAINYPGDVDDCLDFLEEWCRRRACKDEDTLTLACEKEALTTTLRHMNALEVRGVLVRVDGKVSALGIGSRLNETTGVLNFEKAFSEIKGLYQFLDNECAKRLFAECQYINKESDLNLPNLAESKLSYNPVGRVKSFSLTVRNNGPRNG